MTGKKKAAAKAPPTVIVRRNSNRVFGVFIDGTSLDRASRRIQKRVDMSALLKSLTTGGNTLLARYYTLLPQEDDSRHRAFLDAVTKAGFEVVIKRLPPKGINRQVAIDVEMGADIISFGLGREDLSSVSLISASGQFSIMPKWDETSTKVEPRKTISPHPAGEQVQNHSSPLPEPEVASGEDDSQRNRVIVVVCPSRELAYPLALCKHFGADTISADFGKFTSGDLLKSAAKWIDLSDSETIWKD